MQAVVAQSDVMGPQAVSKLWALATTEDDCKAYEDMLLEIIARVSSEMNSRHVAESLWALAEIEVDCSPVQNALMPAVARVAGDMGSSDVASLFWAMARLKAPVCEVETHLLHALDRNVECLLPAEMHKVLQVLDWMAGQCAAEGNFSQTARALRCMHSIAG
jgi:hypothetical protein